MSADDGLPPSPSEPSVLDWFKSLWRGRPIPLGQGPLPDWASDVPRAEARPTAAPAWRWQISAGQLRMPAGLLLALFAQFGLERRTGPIPVFVGAYLLAGLLVAAEVWRGALQLDRAPGSTRSLEGGVRIPALISAAVFSALTFLTSTGNLFRTLTLVFWAAALYSILASLWEGEFGLWVLVRNTLRKFRPAAQGWVISPWSMVILGTMAVLAYFRFVHLDQVPREMVSDHAEKLLDVMDVLSGQTAIFFPRNTGREAFQFYLAAGTATLLGTGVSFLTLKIGTALAGWLMLPFVYALGRESGGRWAGLAALVLGGVGYWPNVLGRSGLRFPLYPLFAAPALFFLVRGLRRRSRNDLLLCGLAMGAGLHGYTPARIVPLVFVLGVGLYLLHRSAQGVRRPILASAVGAAAVMAVVAMPLVSVAVEYPDNVLYRMLTRVGTEERPLPQPAVQILVSNTWNALRMFGWDNGNIWVISLPGRPALDWVTGGLFHMGVVLALVHYVRRRDWLDLFTLLSIPALMLPSILSLAFPDENPAPNRAAAAMIPAFVLAGVFAAQLPAWAARVWPSARARIAMAAGMAGLIALAAMLNFQLVLRDYADLHRRSAWNTSDAGHVIRAFADSVGTLETAHVLAFPHWMDTRLVGIAAGDPARDYAVFPEQLDSLAGEVRAQLFVVNPQDTAGLELLRQIFPSGAVHIWDSPEEGHDLLIYSVLRRHKAERMMESSLATASPPPSRPVRSARKTDLLLVAILAAAAALRFTGLNWDGNQHLHPDERFLTMVESSIRTPDSLAGYFQTDTSPLNPNNVGHNFFVYGTFPIILVRWLGETLGKTGYDDIHLVGRAASATFDLISVLLVYLTADRLYRRSVGLVAAGLSAVTVLLIQHAHFFVVDSFTNTFIVAGLYFAARSLDETSWRNDLLFGLSLGLAAASKISAAPLAGVLVLAGTLRAWRIPAESRQQALARALLGWIAAAAVSLVAFRLAQPYAFAGPGFFSLSLNPRWLANLAEISSQSRGNVDFPPALQWADRAPVFFALRNILFWGMGLPLGIAAWGGWAWALTRWIRGQGSLANGDAWRHALPVVWTGAHFLWQSTGFTPSMRYQLPIYPTLTILAAWALVELWAVRGRTSTAVRQWATVGAGAIWAVVLGGTALYAVAFTSIYTRPVTRVAASSWIYTHLPGAVNMVIETGTEELLDPVPVPFEFGWSDSRPLLLTFTPTYAEAPTRVVLPYVVDLDPELGPRPIRVTVRSPGVQPRTVAAGELAAGLGSAGEAVLEIPLQSFEALQGNVPYELELALEGGAARLRGDAHLFFPGVRNEACYPIAELEETCQRISIPQVGTTMAVSQPLTVSWDVRVPGRLTSVLLPYASGLGGPAAGSTLRVEVRKDISSPAMASGSVRLTGSGDEERLDVPLDRSLTVEPATTYSLQIEVVSGPALLARGSVIASESSWDDGLPLGLDGRGYVGLYSGVNQELYWPDDQDYDEDGQSDKLERLVGTLNQADLLAISSNRQFGTIPRVPIRYPLSTAYYRALTGCPEPQEVAECADRLQPGWVSPELGYELAAVIRSDPSLGPISISDQSAEEVFTVYDHPMVLLFRKTPQFSASDVRSFLSQVDLRGVVHVLPREAGSAPASLLLPEDRWEAQRARGTWSDLFDRASILARSDVAATVVWWLTIAALGWLAFPLIWTAFPGLRDGGYTISRMLSLLVLGWGMWILASLQVAPPRPALYLCLAALAAASGAIAWSRRAALVEHLRRQKREILIIEVLALALFLLDLGIRLGNPDLWHPAKGGEKPMDLAYLTAVLRSVSFPPYDPWFAGGYINYYYFGFVIVSVPIHLLRMMPTQAYNLVVPSLFSILGLTAYGAAYNLLAPADPLDRRTLGARVGGVAASLGLVVLGNLGSARMIYEGWKRIGLLPGQEPAAWVAGFVQVVRGFLRYVTFESPMPYAMDSWYWDPSRAIPPGPGEVGPITEFPFFTFLYSDLHAHMMALPLTVLGLVWVVAILRRASSGKGWRPAEAVLGLFFGGLVFGSLRPTNTWDFPVYLALGAAALFVSPYIRQRTFTRRGLLEGLGGAAALVGASVVLFLPYAIWYGQGYTAADMWVGSRTDLLAYVTVHGLFLFVLISWLAWETREWMAATPLTALQRIRPWASTLAGGALAFVAAVVFLGLRGFGIAWIVVPLVAWCGVLLLRPGLPVSKRIVLALTAAAALLTFVVDVVVLRGDISRMNTVFKFYLQVWTMFSVGAGAALVWILEELPAWSPGWRRGWLLGFGFLVFSAALYPVIAAPAKMRDRMEISAPHRLDGMAFMDSATYIDQGSSFPLAEDARAIRWLQDEIEGTPVIVEAHVPEYRWGARIANYTGLPTVLGWKHHQNQQRVASGDPVTPRAIEVSEFYLTPSAEEAQGFLDRYAVEYVVLGRLERLYYDQLDTCLPVEGTSTVSCDLASRLFGVGPVLVDAGQCTVIDPAATELRYRCRSGGIGKFDRLERDGRLSLVYRDGETVIYEVVR